MKFNTYFENHLGYLPILFSNRTYFMKKKTIFVYLSVFHNKVVFSTILIFMKFIGTWKVSNCNFIQASKIGISPKKKKKQQQEEPKSNQHL